MESKYSYPEGSPKQNNSLYFLRCAQCGSEKIIDAHYLKSLNKKFSIRNMKELKKI